MLKSVYEPIPFADFIDRDDEEMKRRARAFYDDIRRRHTCRDFADTPVPREVIADALRAAGTAPSGANHQPWHFVVISAPEVKAQVRQGAEDEERTFYREKAPKEWLDALAPLGTDDVKPYLETAPWLIVVFGQRRGGIKKDDDQRNYYVTESVGIATGFLLAALHQAGLATLTHTPAPMRFLNEICGRPESEKPMMLVVVGKPASGATMPKHATLKKSLDDVTTWI